MKHSRTWFALILIASALLLSAASSADALQNERDNHTHNDHPQQQSETAQAQPPVLVPSPAYYAAILGELRAIVREEIAKDEQEHADRKDWNTPAFWVNVFIAIVGAAYTIVAYRQLNAIRRQAKIAQDMLDKDRPAIIVTDCQLTGYGPNPTTLPPAEQNKIEKYTPIVATFSIKNVGPAIALMESAVACVDVFPCLKEFPKGEFPPVGDYSKCRPLFLQKTILKTDDSEFQAAPKEAAYFSPEEYRDLQVLKAVVVFYGIVKYNSVVKREKPCETPFFFVYQPAGGFMPKGVLYHGPDHRERNRAT
jgi:hypothetical protein